MTSKKSNCPRRLISDIVSLYRYRSSERETPTNYIMDAVEHRTLVVNGISMHVAMKGPENGPVVLLIHGFPELWYSWRHQMVALAAVGFRAVAPDLRGFGETEAPGDASKYTCMHVVGDLVALIDAVAPNGQVFVVGHDFGAYMAWYLALFRPDKVKAMVNLSVFFTPIKANHKIIQTLRALYGDDYYMCRFQEPGEIEAEFAQMGTERVLKEFLTYRTPGPLFLPKGKGFGTALDDPIELPSWLSEKNIRYYTSKFEKQGFTGGLNYYRNMNMNWELTAPWSGVEVKVPAKFIVGDQDLTYNSYGAKDFIHKGGFNKHVPLLQEVVVMEGVGHFINQEKAEEISQHIIDFIQKF